MGKKRCQVFETTIPLKEEIVYLRKDMNPFTGSVYEEFESGKIKFEANYKDGIPHGYIKEWYENGFLKYEYNFKKGVLHGKLEMWNEEGRLFASADYKNNIPITKYVNIIEGRKCYGFDNLVSYYFNEDEFTAISERYDILSEYSKNGKDFKFLYRVVEYIVPPESWEFGTQQIIQYLPLYSNLESEEFEECIEISDYPICCEPIESLCYRHGLLHGKQTYWKEYYQTWSSKTENQEFVVYKVREENYVNGKKEGPQYKWDENEKLIEEENYKKGQKHGRQLYGYIHEGTLWKEENYSKGAKDGPQRYWKDGILWKEEKYSRGIMNGDQITYDFIDDDLGYESRGNTTDTYRNGTLTKSITSDRWSLQFEHNFKDGKPHGRFQAGLFESFYQFGLRHGFTRGWYDSKQLRFEIKYVHDMPNGKFKVWYENGRLKEEWQYKYGLLDGPFKIFFSDGNVQMQGHFEENNCIQLSCWDVNGKLVESPEHTPKPFFWDAISNKFIFS